MFKLIDYYRNANGQTKMFILVVILYGVAILASAIFPYARLDYERSYPTQHHKEY